MTISEQIYNQIKENPEVKEILLHPKQIIQLIDENIYKNYRTHYVDDLVSVNNVEFFNINNVSIKCKC